MDSKDDFRCVIQGINGTTLTTISTQLNITEVGHYSFNFYISNDYERFVFKHNGATLDLKITINKKLKAKNTYIVSFDVIGFNSSVIGGLVVDNIKVEKGNKPTDWTPAPEDIQEDIHNSKQEAIEASRAYIDIKEREINSNVENIKTVIDGHTTAISTVQSSVQQTENKVNTVFTQTEEIKNLTDQNTTQLEEYKQYISMEPVRHEGETEARPTITLGQSTSSFKVAIDNKEIAFTGASGEKVAYITGDELRINNVVVVRKLAIGDFFLEQEENGHLVLKKGR